MAINSVMAQFFDAIRLLADVNQHVRFTDIRKVCTQHHLPLPTFFLHDHMTHVRHGVYRIPSDDYIERVYGDKGYGTRSGVVGLTVKVPPPSVDLYGLGSNVIVPDPAISYVPQSDPFFEPCANFAEIDMIIQSKEFFPLYIYGPPGFGKSLSPMEAAARAGREMIRLQFFNTTDEEDLLGSDTVAESNGLSVIKFRIGPVVVAMLRGCPILLDEIDQAPAAVMCLQPVLEGKPLFLPKINRYIYPAEGFTIIATANTKGHGDTSGIYTWSNQLNAAMKDRFMATLEQKPPSEDAERLILMRHLEARECPAPDFVERLLQFATMTRIAAENYHEQISTRRLVHICRAYAIYGSEQIAVERCISGFPDEVQEVFLKSWEAVADVVAPAHSAPIGTAVPDDDIQF